MPNQQPGGPDKNTPLALIRIPNDLGGKETRIALASAPVPAVPPRTTAKAKAYVSPIDAGEITTPTPPPPLASLPLVPFKSPNPTPPGEAVPQSLGAGTADVFVFVANATQTRFSTPGVLNPGAADIKPLAKQLPDRAPTDDPTAELLRGRVVDTPLNIPAVEMPTLRPTLPDPFEFAEQLRGKLFVREFGNTPPPIPPPQLATK